MDKKKLLNISKSLMFEINEDVANSLEQEFSILENKINKMKSIDTDNINPMTSVDETPITFLREDKVGEALQKDAILNNAPNSDNDFIIINKEAKDE